MLRGVGAGGGLPADLDSRNTQAFTFSTASVDCLIGFYGNSVPPTVPWCHPILLLGFILVFVCMHVREGEREGGRGERGFGETYIQSIYSAY